MCDEGVKYNDSPEIKMSFPQKLVNIKIRSFKERYKERRNRFLVWFVLNPVRKFVNYVARKIENQWLLSRLKHEWKAAGFLNMESYENHLFLASLYSILDKYCDCSGNTLSDLVKLSRFELLAPMKFTDDEFGHPYGIDPEDGTRQSSRLSHVFKYTDDFFVDVEGISWVTKSQLDMSNMEAGLKEYPFIGGHNGTAMLYLEDKDEWIPMWSGSRIDTKKPYYGDYHIQAPVIEIYDSTDKKNDFFCYILKYSDIPEEFFKHYILTDARKYPGRNKRNVNGKSWYDECITWLKENHAEKLFDAEVEKMLLFRSYYLDEGLNTCMFVCDWISEKEKLESLLINKHGVDYKHIKVVYDENSINLIVASWNDYKEELKFLFDENSQRLFNEKQNEENK